MSILSNNHWTIENYKQRITLKEWQKILLDGDDTHIVNGRLRKFVAKRVGPGVYEVYKQPLDK